MTIHLPGRAAPATEISSELSRILAEQAERDEQRPDGGQKFIA